MRCPSWSHYQGEYITNKAEKKRKGIQRCYLFVSQRSLPSDEVWSYPSRGSTETVAGLDRGDDFSEHLPFLRCSAENALSTSASKMKDARARDV